MATLSTPRSRKARAAAATIRVYERHVDGELPIGEGSLHRGKSAAQQAHRPAVLPQHEGRKARERTASRLGAQLREHLAAQSARLPGIGDQDADLRA